MDNLDRYYHSIDEELTACAVIFSEERIYWGLQIFVERLIHGINMDVKDMI